MEQHSNEIIPGLFLGDAGFVYEDLVFELIVNCCPEVDMRYKQPSNVIYLKFNDDPRDNDKFLSELKKHNVLEQIHEHVVTQKPVIVHCAMGVQRSASVVACYLLYRWTFKKPTSPFRVAVPNVWSDNGTAVRAFTRREPEGVKYDITNGVQNTLDFIRGKRVGAFGKGCNFLQAINEFV